MFKLPGRASDAGPESRRVADESDCDYGPATYIKAPRVAATLEAVDGTPIAEYGNVGTHFYSVGVGPFVSICDGSRATWPKMTRLCIGLNSTDGDEYLVPTGGRLILEAI